MYPIVMISGEPSLRRRTFVVFFHDVLVGSKDPRSTLREIDLHAAELAVIASTWGQRGNKPAVYINLVYGQERDGG